MDKILKKTLQVSLEIFSDPGGEILVFFVTVSKNNSHSGCSSNSECSGLTPICRHGQCVPGLSLCVISKNGGDLAGNIMPWI